MEVAVLRALPGLGDLLCMVPALRALRAHHPDGRITLVGLGSARSFVERFGAYVDDLLVVSSFPCLPETQGSAAEALSFLSSAQRRGFDLAVGLHGSGPVSNVLLSLLGASRLIGTSLPGQPVPDGDFIAYPDARPEIHRLLAPLQHAGIAAQGDHLEWPHRVGDRPGPELPQPFAVIHAGASRPDRRWSPAGFAAVAAELRRRGLHIALTGGLVEASTAKLVRHEIAQHARLGDCADRTTVVDLTGATELDQLADVLRRARLTVTNDTGVSHLAAALAAPSVVVFTTSDPARWAPLDQAQHLRADLRPLLERGADPARQFDVVIEAVERALG